MAMRRTQEQMLHLQSTPTKSAHYQGTMPPPVGPVGRKATPGGGRGGRRGQASTPRPRKPRSSNKLHPVGDKVGMSYPNSNDVAAYQQQVSLHQHQQQQQPAKLAIPKSPVQTPNEPSANNFQNNSANSSATTPNVVVVSSASSTVNANVAAKSTMTQASTVTQMARQNSPSHTAAAASLRIPNIPQVGTHCSSLPSSTQLIYL